jgi:hypothetical protein
MHYTLTVALTATLTIEWIFSNLSDFERAGTAARAARAGAPMVDVDDLQALIDSTLAPFHQSPMEGDVGCRMFSAAATAEAITA